MYSKLREFLNLFIAMYIELIAVQWATFFTIRNFNLVDLISVFLTQTEATTITYIHFYIFRQKLSSLS